MTTQNYGAFFILSSLSIRYIYDILTSKNHKYEATSEFPNSVLFGFSSISTMKQYECIGTSKV